MNLLALIERHRNDPNPHPRLRVDLTPEQLAAVIAQVLDAIPGLPDVPDAGDVMPKATTFGVAGTPGSDDEYARSDHRHPLVLTPNLDALAVLNQTGWVRRDTGSIWSARDGGTESFDLLVYHDQKTGMQRHRRAVFDRGQFMYSTLGPWHPYHEPLSAIPAIVDPCGGTPPPTGSHLYRHVSNALAYRADSDNTELIPRIRTPLVCDSAISGGVSSASVNVAANAAATWYGTILPITFINRRTTVAKYVIQLSAASSLPSGHRVSANIGNIPECETGFLLELPQAFDPAEDVQPDGGELTVYLFLGLGLTSGAETTTAQRVGYSLQVDTWLV